MRIFLSYSSEDHERAEEIALALEGQGHDVFFDRTDLRPGADYNSVIRERLGEADLFLFLITPRSVAPGTYTLSELMIAREKWAHPRDRVLPVMLAPTELADVPPYLRGVTILEPHGNVAAEVAAHVAARKPRLRAARVAIGGAAVLALAILGFVLLRPAGESDSDADHADPQGPTTPAAARWPIRETDFLPRMTYPPSAVERLEYMMDPAHRFGEFASDFVRVENFSMGEISDTAMAVSVEVVLANTTARPFLLDIDERFFELLDDRGREGKLLFFCCGARGETLGTGEERRLKLIFAAHGGWIGKETAAHHIYLRATGLRPLIAGLWSVPAAVAAH